MRAPPLSTTPTQLQSLFLTSETISPSAAFVERHRVIISTAPPLTGVISENPDNLLSLFELSQRPYEPRSGYTTHNRESTMDRELIVVSWSKDLIHDFSYKK
jgi:hypothetical protein